MKNEKLTTDEFDALEQVARGLKGERISACVGRNTKRLSGLKLFSFSKDGRLTLTDKGHEVLFVRRCITGLRAVAANPQTKLDPDIATFLGKKAHITALDGGAAYEITDKGRESLADMDAQGH
ncbi:MAG TPA: hypothetical protein VGP06_08480 [Janthinobacterium sp.]|nr:hypothetical protein [Janthinobacterium sp.]